MFVGYSRFQSIFLGEEEWKGTVSNLFSTGFPIICPGYKAEGESRGMIIPLLPRSLAFRSSEDHAGTSSSRGLAR